MQEKKNSYYEKNFRGQKKQSYNLLEFQSYWIFEELKKGLHLFLEKVKLNSSLPL